MDYVNGIADNPHLDGEEYRQTLDLDCFFYKAFTSMGRAYAQKGMYEEAISMLQKGRSLSGDMPNILGALGQTYALAGKGRQACDCLERLTAMAEDRHLSSSCFAILHLGLGNVEKSLEWLEHACDQRESQVGGLKVHPVYDPLRSEPRFQAILERIGFLR